MKIVKHKIINIFSPFVKGELMAKVIRSTEDNKKFINTTFYISEWEKLDSQTIESIKVDHEKRLLGLS